MEFYEPVGVFHVIFSHFRMFTSMCHVHRSCNATVARSARKYGNSGPGRPEPPRKGLLRRVGPLPYFDGHTAAVRCLPYAPTFIYVVIQGYTPDLELRYVRNCLGLRPRTHEHVVTGARYTS